MVYPEGTFRTPDAAALYKAALTKTRDTRGIVMEILVVVLTVCIVFLAWLDRKASQKLARMEAANDDLNARFNVLRQAKEQLDATHAEAIRSLTQRAKAAEQDRDSLAKFTHVRDVAQEADRLMAEASETVNRAQKGRVGNLGGSQS